MPVARGKLVRLNRILSSRRYLLRATWPMLAASAASGASTGLTIVANMITAMAKEKLNRSWRVSSKSTVSRSASKARATKGSTSSQARDWTSATPLTAIAAKPPHTVPHSTMDASIARFAKTCRTVLTTQLSAEN